MVKMKNLFGQWRTTRMRCELYVRLLYYFKYKWEKARDWKTSRLFLA